MKFRIIISFILLQFSALTGYCSEVTIHGKAPAYASRKISLNVYQDYLSMKLQKLNETLIDEKGNFTLLHNFETVREVVLRIDGVSTFFYVQPGAVYNVHFPDLEAGKIKTFYNNQVEILFDTLPLYDINNLILDFDDLLDEFIGKNYKRLGSPNFRIEVDTFRNQVSKRYKNIHDPFFREYVRYSFASIDQIGGINVDMSILKALLFREYLSSGNILYTHPKYMLFFNQYYTDVFKLTDKNEEIEIFNAIEYKQSHTLIGNVLKKDDFLKNDRIRELVIIKSLSEEYYSQEYNQENIIKILDSIKEHSVFGEHRLIAEDMISVLTHLGTGYEAPAFELLNEKNEQVSLEKFRGKYVYLQFWASWNSSSVSEMKIMRELNKKYGKDVVFISVNMDESTVAWKKFLKENPDMKWVHLHYGNYPEIIDLYRINSLSIYYLIGPDGKLIQSPALRPTPDGTFRSIEISFAEISRFLHKSGR